MMKHKIQLQAGKYICDPLLSKLSEQVWSTVHYLSEQQSKETINVQCMRYFESY